MHAEDVADLMLLAELAQARVAAVDLVGGAPVQPGPGVQLGGQQPDAQFGFGRELQAGGMPSSARRPASDSCSAGTYSREPTSECPRGVL